MFSHSLSESVLKCCDNVKYLGHIIPEDMSGDVDIYRQRGVANGQANTFLQKFGSCTEEVKVVPFNAFCTLLYTAYLWANSIRGCSDALRVFLKKTKWTSTSEKFLCSRINTLQA